MTAQWWLSETLCYLTPPRGDRPRDAQRRRSGAVERHLNLDTVVLGFGRVRIDELLNETDEPLFSFEFFPPKTDEGEANL